MFPNQQGRDPWGSVAGYYGYPAMGGEGWYSWASPPPGRPASQWGPGYSTESEPSAGMSGRAESRDSPGTAASAGSSASDGARDLTQRQAPPRSQDLGQRLGINTNIYSLYQGGPGRQGRAGEQGGGEEEDPLQQGGREGQGGSTDSPRAMEPDSSTEDPLGPDKADAQTSRYPDVERSFSEEGRIQNFNKPTTAKMPITKASTNASMPPALKKKQFSSSLLDHFSDMVKEEGDGPPNFPLCVEINEMEDSSESVSPPRARPFLPPTSSLSPRKRGRKPKHYSEILFELGQRGISITKTHKGEGDQRVSHKTGGQQLKCPHCNKILTTSVGLMYHIRLHTGEKPYSCDLCGKSFATSSHYHYHIRSHSGEKPYRCDFCGKMYTASGSLRLHLKSHLSRLAANAFNTLNNFSQDRDPLQPDFLAIKLEVDEDGARREGGAGSSGPGWMGGGAPQSGGGGGLRFGVGGGLVGAGGAPLGIRGGAGGLTREFPSGSGVVGISPAVEVKVGVQRFEDGPPRREEGTEGDGPPKTERGGAGGGTPIGMGLGEGGRVEHPIGIGGEVGGSGWMGRGGPQGGDAGRTGGSFASGLGGVGGGGGGSGSGLPTGMGWKEGGAGCGLPLGLGRQAGGGPPIGVGGGAGGGEGGGAGGVASLGGAGRAVGGGSPPLEELGGEGREGEATNMQGSNLVDPRKDVGKEDDRRKDGGFEDSAKREDMVKALLNQSGIQL